MKTFFWYYLGLTPKKCTIILLPKNLVTERALQLQENTNRHIKIHKDNVGALALEKLEPC